MHLDVIQQYLATALEEDRKAQERLDHIVLVGGAGAILASVTFLKDIAPAPMNGTLPVLLIAWILLAIGGLFAMLSFASTRLTAKILQNAYAAMIKERRDRMTEKEFAEASDANQGTVFKTQLAVGSFGFGMLALLGFAGINLPWSGQPSVVVAPSSSHSQNAMTADPKPPAARPPEDAPFKRGFDFTIPNTVRPEPTTAPKPQTPPPDSTKE